MLFSRFRFPGIVMLRLETFLIGSFEYLMYGDLNFQAGTPYLSPPFSAYQIFNISKNSFLKQYLLPLLCTGNACFVIWICLGNSCMIYLTCFCCTLFSFVFLSLFRARSPIDIYSFFSIFPCIISFFCLSIFPFFSSSQFYILSSNPRYILYGLRGSIQYSFES